MLHITRYDPLGDAFDELFKGIFIRPAALEAAGPAGRMKIDLSEQEGEFKMLAELPGVKKEDILVELDGDQVSVTAEGRAENETRQGARLIHRERHCGKVSRVFRLGQEIDEARASATYHDGVLELVLPKKAAADRRRITVQ